MAWPNMCASAAKVWLGDGKIGREPLFQAHKYTREKGEKNQRKCSWQNVN